MTAKIDEKRFAKVQKRGLDHGAHRNVTDGMCAMEAFSYIRRIPFTDLRCLGLSAPVAIAAFCIIYFVAEFLR